jgi:hypothetical protein
VAVCFLVCLRQPNTFFFCDKDMRELDDFSSLPIQSQFVIQDLIKWKASEALDALEQFAADYPTCIAVLYHLGRFYATLLDYEAP